MKKCERITSDGSCLYLDMRATSHRIIRAVAIVGPLLFFTIATVEGFLRPGYDPIAQPISALAIGDRGWIQGINFLIFTSSLLAFAALLRAEFRDGFASHLAPSAFFVMAIGVAFAGLFPMDAPGVVATRSGAIHGVAGFFVFPVIPLAVVLMSLRFRREAHWRPYFGISLVIGLLNLATIICFLTLVGPPGTARPYSHLMGLVQRIDLVPFLVWIALIAHRSAWRSIALDETRCPTCASIGSATVNVEPVPRSVVTETDPPCASTRWRVM